MLWTFRIVALVSVLGAMTAIAVTRPAPVGLDANEREARAGGVLPWLVLVLPAAGCVAPRPLVGANVASPGPAVAGPACWPWGARAFLR